MSDRISLQQVDEAVHKLMQHRAHEMRILIAYIEQEAEKASAQTRAQECTNRDWMAGYATAWGRLNDRLVSAIPPPLRV